MMMNQEHMQQAFIDQLERKGRKPSTRERYRYDLDDFFKWLKNKPFTDLDQADVEDFFYELIEQRQYKTRTTRRIASVLRQFTYFIQEEHPSPDHPLLTYEAPSLTLEPLSRAEWLSQDELKQLLWSTHSDHDLSDNQLLARPQLTERNYALFLLLSFYGLTLQELCELKMNQINLMQRTIHVENGPYSRTMYIDEATAKQIHAYLILIPEPVRPRFHSHDPLFVAYDFTRRTYHWSYERDAPKELTEIALQKVIRTEVARAELRKGISAQHFRHSFILRLLLNEENIATTQQQTGLRSLLSFRRYALTISQLTDKQKQALLHPTNEKEEIPHETND